MVKCPEETGLNHYLESRGIEVIESNLGEYIIQLAREPPYTEGINQLTRIARTVLRDRFAAAGISGVNFAVAETGTLCLVENEGNSRPCLKP